MADDKKADQKGAAPDVRADSPAPQEPAHAQDPMRRQAAEPPPGAEPRVPDDPKEEDEKRPAGKYRLKRDYYDGRYLFEKGTVQRFDEGKAPTSATYLD